MASRTQRTNARVLTTDATTNDVRPTYGRSTLKALVFEFDITRLAAARALGSLHSRGYLSALGPLRLRDVPDARLLGDRWVIVATEMCGVCGSDVKQVFMDAALDNPLPAMISFPHVLGHEHVGVVVDVGHDVRRVRRGDRVACSPWLSCVVRGLPECEACRRGQTSLCASFTQGELSAGMHAGTCRDVSGGFASHVPVHETGCFPVPEAVSFERAVLADPVAVAFHAMLRSPPRPGETVVVIGCGSLGVVLVHLLAQLHPRSKVIAVDPRAHARELASRLGANVTFASQGAALVEDVARAVDAPVLRPRFALPWLRGGVHRVFDTVGSARSLEAAVRILRPRGTLVLVGVSRPARFEWTPLYFKELQVLGSSGYGTEDFEGRRAHAIEHVLDLVATGRIDPAFVLTHRFALDEYKEAFLTARSKGGSESMKVAFDFSR
jgi:threonine dehydrogenase-like Zn-dependent dehydrogenase